MNDIGDDPNLVTTLVQVAHLYYEQDYSQQQIADALGVSRSLISLYLKKARERGVVKIQVNDPRDNCEDLSLIIQSKTSVNRVFVVPSSHNSAMLTRRSTAGALARYLESTLKDGDCVGIGFGRTIAEMAELIVPTKPHAIDFIPLMGESSSGLIGTYSQINLHVLKIASSFNGTPHFLLAPLIVQSPELRDLLVMDDGVRSTVQYWDHLTHVCVGVGAVPPAAGEIVYVGEENLNAFAEIGGAGDVCIRYFNDNGQFIHTPFYNRVIGISPEQMHKAEHFIVVSSGADKAQAVAALLYSNIITELFIDEELARAIINRLR